MKQQEKFLMYLMRNLSDLLVRRIRRRSWRRRTERT